MVLLCYTFLAGVPVIRNIEYRSRKKESKYHVTRYQNGLGILMSVWAIWHNMFSSVIFRKHVIAKRYTVLMDTFHLHN